MTVLTTVDTISKFVDNIPADFAGIQQVNGYITEVGTTGDIKWTDANWHRFPHYVEKRIAQLPDNDPAADILDVETGAATDKAAIDWVKMLHAKLQPAVVYVDKSNVASLYSALGAVGELDQTYIWLADWSLDENEAAALLGTEYGGFKVVGVQWASPTSNPRTLLPGTNYTLADCGCDLSVFSPWPEWKGSARHIRSIVAVVTYDDGSKKSWTVS